MTTDWLLARQLHAQSQPSTVQPLGVTYLVEVGMLHVLDRKLEPRPTFGLPLQGLVHFRYAYTTKYQQLTATSDEVLLVKARRRMSPFEVNNNR